VEHGAAHGSAREWVRRLYGALPPLPNVRWSHGRHSTRHGRTLSISTHNKTALVNIDMSKNIRLGV